MDIEVRGLAEKDWPDALVLAERVFGVGPWLFHSQHKSSLDRRFSDACGAWVDGELVSLVDVFFRQVRMPDAQTAKMAGIGTVCTHPCYRSQGLSGRLIKRVDQVMIEQGAEWSMLFTGVQSHYARYGWVEVPRSWREKEQASVPDQPVSSLRIEAKDWWKLNEPMMLADLYNAASDGLSASVVRDKEQWNGANRERMNRPECRTFLAWEEEKLAGYMIASLGSELELTEASGGQAALEQLSHAACSWAAAEGKSRVNIKLPARQTALLPPWLLEGAEMKSGSWTMVKTISGRWSQNELNELFTSNQTHHFELDNF